MYTHIKSERIYDFKNFCLQETKADVSQLNKRKKRERENECMGKTLEYLMKLKEKLYLLDMVG